HLKSLLLEQAFCFSASGKIVGWLLRLTRPTKTSEARAAGNKKRLPVTREPFSLFAAITRFLLRRS
ncbi:hypothetical protein, partial [Enterobacter cloacae]|uniref:hypothetical protein n=1 Tax=Enterobacter cloacae TaxID=550 RepID=UPI001C681DE6